MCMGDEASTHEFRDSKTWVWIWVWACVLNEQLPRVWTLPTLMELHPLCRTAGVCLFQWSLRSCYHSITDPFFLKYLWENSKFIPWGKFQPWNENIPESEERWAAFSGGRRVPFQCGGEEGEHISLPSWCFLLPFFPLKIFFLPCFPPVFFLTQYVRYPSSHPCSNSLQLFWRLSGPHLSSPFLL